MEPGNEPFVVGDEIIVNNRVGTVSYSAALEGFFATYYHLSCIWRDNIYESAQFTDNTYKDGNDVTAFNPRTKQSINLIQYVRNETKETSHVGN